MRPWDKNTAHPTETFLFGKVREYLQELFNNKSLSKSAYLSAITDKCIFHIFLDKIKPQTYGKIVVLVNQAEYTCTLYFTVRQKVKIVFHLNLVKTQAERQVITT